MRRYLDLRSSETISGPLRSTLAKFSNRQQAGNFAKQYGWNRSDATLATTRLQAYWIVGQCVGDQFRALDWDGKPVEFGFAGFV